MFECAARRRYFFQYIIYCSAVFCEILMGESNTHSKYRDNRDLNIMDFAKPGSAKDRTSLPIPLDHETVNGRPG